MTGLPLGGFRLRMSVMPAPVTLEHVEPEEIAARARRLPPGRYRVVFELESGEDKLANLRFEIQRGLDQAERGEVVDGAEVFRKLRETYALTR